MKTSAKTCDLSFYFYLIASVLATAGVGALLAQRPKPKHINRMIDVLEQGQPIYYMSSHEGTEGGFELGKKDAQTWADYIVYDMEHAPYNIQALADYMRGLAAGGPTRTGHRMPAVIVDVPVSGTDEATVRANAWMFQQALAAGVHGFLLCHADTPGAVRAFVESVRFPLHHQGVGQEGLQEGRRGVHGASTAAKIWGISTEEYLDKADPWPLNPNGELVLGIKVEDKYAYANIEESMNIPGIAVGEGGPGDVAISLGFKSAKDPKVMEVEAKVFAMAKAHKIFWNGINPGPGDAVINAIKAGYMIGIGQETAEIGRKFTNRRMPY
jgi:4-hydroxy-2-oxoheptanedioate aldolase